MCDICRFTPCRSGCSNAEPKSSGEACEFCGQDILIGEEYVKNIYGEFRHFDCYGGIKDLLDWLGFPVMVMEEDAEN